MKIKEVKDNKRKYMNLLLIADEQEDMIERYIDRGKLYVLEDGFVRTVCIVICESDNILEIKNIATSPESQKMGYGKAMIEFIESLYRDKFSILQVGTGDSPLTTPFYIKCGFKESHRVKNFFTDNYDHPIVEDGVLLCDMVYFRKNL